MTDLKRVPASVASEKDKVEYLWVRSRRRPKKTSPAASKKNETAANDPLSAPWGDIVETPLRVLRRLFNRD